MRYFRFFGSLVIAVVLARFAFFSFLVFVFAIFVSLVSSVIAPVASPALAVSASFVLSVLPFVLSGFAFFSLDSLLELVEFFFGRLSDAIHSLGNLFLGGFDTFFGGDESILVALAYTCTVKLDSVDLWVPEGSHHQLESSSALADV